MFYIKKSGELLSSSTAGFIILPKLQPGTHQFTIGFPKEEFPEYEFKVEISGKDKGYTLKNYQNKGWGLLDMQTMDVNMGKRLNGKKESARQYGAMSDDPFAVILAAVVNDPGIRETSLVQTAAMVSAPVNKPADKPVDKPVATKDNAKVDSKTHPSKNKNSQGEVKPPAAEVATATAVDKKSTQKTGETKTDPPVTNTQTTPPKEDLAKADTKTTTNTTTSPATTQDKKEPAPLVLKDSQQVKTKSTKTNQKYVAQKVVKISELKTWSGYQLVYIDNSGSIPDTIHVTLDDGIVDSAAVKVSEASPKEVKAKTPRTNCKTMAREKDVLNLRKKMLSLGSDAEKVDAVVKEAKTNCYTVEQIQNLSYVFINDEGRYALFEKAYPLVFDPANYFRLEKLFNSDEYMSRFRNLIN